MRYLEELTLLNLPPDQYAIFGGGPLAIRGLRENSDIDVIVKQELWRRLAETHRILQHPYECIKIGHIEFNRDWLPWFEDINPLIDTSELIAGIPFVKLSYVLEWKRRFGRERDLQDIVLIQKFRQTQTSLSHN